MTFPAGSHVLIELVYHGHAAVGTVKRVLAGGLVHEIEMADGQVIPFMGDVLKPAPENVSMFRKPAEEQRQWL